MGKFITYLLQLIMSPARGWEDIANADVDPRQLCSSGFYPLLGIAALSAFINGFYSSDITMVMMIKNAIATFISFFVAYFLSVFILSTFIVKLTDDNMPGEARIHTFAIYILSFLALVSIISNLLPLDLSIVQFLPAYAIVMIWLGRSYLECSANGNFKFMLLSVTALIATPYLLSLIFNVIL